MGWKLRVNLRLSDGTIYSYPMKHLHSKRLMTKILQHADSEADYLNNYHPGYRCFCVSWMDI